MREYCVQLPLGLKARIMLFNPARTVVGGGIAKAGETLFVPLGEVTRGGTSSGQAP